MPLAFACLVYIGAIVGANLTIAAFGPWVSPINSFLLIGLDLTLRDRLHDVWGGKNLWPKMFALIAVAGLVSYVVNPAAGRIAIASSVSFILAGLVDAGVYHWLRSRAKTSDYMIRVNGSNAAGALVDSFVFPTLAFGVFMPAIVAMQFAAKLGGGYVWSLILRRLAIESR
jgi:hypothetical protein